MVGKKVVMAVTGLVLVGFVIGHMLGNLKIFLGAEAIDDEFTKMTAILDLRSSVFGSVRE